MFDYRFAAVLIALSLAELRAQTPTDSTPNSDPTSGASPVSLSEANEKVFGWMIDNCTNKKPGGDFWKNPNDGGVGGGQNGWQGAQGIQSAIINYECTHDDKYLQVVKDFANWVQNDYGGRNNLTLCQCWPDYDVEHNKPIGNSPDHFCMWGDDAGWVINMYLQFAQYGGKPEFLDLAYQTLLNSDKQWGVDFKNNSRGLVYYDHQDRYAIYMSAQILGALGLWQAYSAAGDQDKANTALGLACHYYNFVENYLHSTGPGKLNVTDTPFKSAPNLYEEEARFHAAPKTPDPDAKSSLVSGRFTSAHMMMTAVYVLFDQCSQKGADLSQVNAPFNNFQERAIAAANAFTTLAPAGYLENGLSGHGTVFLCDWDPNVNGFGCYWWVKYVVPLNPERYGKVVMRTAREIIAHQGIGDISQSRWNTANPRDHQEAGNWVFVRQASACSIVAAAHWIATTCNFSEE